MNSGVKKRKYQKTNSCRENMRHFGQNQWNHPKISDKRILAKLTKIRKKILAKKIVLKVKFAKKFRRKSAKTKEKKILFNL